MEDPRVEAEGKLEPAGRRSCGCCTRSPHGDPPKPQCRREVDGIVGDECAAPSVTGALCQRQAGPRSLQSGLVDTGLSGRGVLVTGGAGGIGSAVCRAFAAEGALVAIHYRTSRTEAEALAAELGAVALEADLRVEGEADRLIPAAAVALGRLDVCVANAGVWPVEDSPIWEMPLQRWEETLAANLRVSFLTARAFLRHAAVTGTGSLVLVGSTAGKFGEPGHSDYAAAKAAIQGGLLLSIKNEAARLGPGVRVNAVAPGWTVTSMIREANLDQEQVARITATMALKKLGRPGDIASQVVTLASDKLSGHVTGQVVVVAGGMEGRII